MKWVCSLLMLFIGTRAFGTSSNDEVKSGAYWVPVEEQLAPFALFSLPEVHLRWTEDRVRVEFNLPMELTGLMTPVALEGPRVSSGPLILTGGYGTMECPGPDDLSNCAVSYHNVTFDPNARTTVLKSISKSEDELQKRESVAARFQFGGEPHGFLRVDTSLSSSASY